MIRDQETLNVLLDNVARFVRERESRLRRLSRTVRADGFRPGKVPLKMVAQQQDWNKKNCQHA